MEKTRPLNLNIIGKKKVNNGYYYYDLTKEDSYDTDRANDDTYLIYVAPLEIGENLVGKVEDYIDVQVKAGSYKAYKVKLNEEEIFGRTIWVVPHFGIIKEVKAYNENGPIVYKELVSD